MRLHWEVSILQYGFFVFAACFNSGALSDEVAPCFGVNNSLPITKEGYWVPSSVFSHHSTHKLNLDLIGHKKRPDISDMFPMLGHGIDIGEGSTFSYGEYFLGWPGTTDTEMLTRVSIYIPDMLVNDRKMEFDLAKSEAIVFYSAGFPAFRSYCYGYAATGRFRAATRAWRPLDPINQRIFSVLNNEGGAHITIDAKIELRSTETKKQNVCGQCVLRADLVVPKTTVIKSKDKMPILYDNP
ncbi:hypothetical protein [Methylogaea oryzae]|uniref:Uncharacterized protein n=1 Tax=Methylogaea oryzae TaxID=1295382 RepID=A0A8D5AIX8_9GAMM|nr:hypothetical protein [Methylogaea oryzae]BBL71816.1 hypothetical protein MoryE10_24220 [Methylogaea oryzae]